MVLTKMALVLTVAFSVSVSSVIGAVIESRSALEHEHEHVVAVPTWMYKSDCWTRKPVKGLTGLLQTEYVPGAGIKKFTPFETVEKDGFMEIDCVKDYMYYHGDKFGDARQAYKLEEVSNVSIVHYDAHVKKEDRQPMTQAVCFEFCRTVPLMGFFGIVNGNNCYCAPYYKQMAGDSSDCDNACPGDSTTFCGGKSKSSIFSLHMCDSTKGDLTESSLKAKELAGEMTENAEHATTIGKEMQTNAADAQTVFSNVGDSAAARNLQKAKEFAGVLEHSAEDVEALAKKLTELHGKAAAITDFKDPKQVTEAEQLMASIDTSVGTASAANTDLEKKIGLAEVDKPVKDSAKEYFPIMYFVDRKLKDVPSTCGGENVNEPILGGVDACATACNRNFQTCVGFSHFADKNLCFLLSKFKSAVAYTGCDSKKKAPEFLQGAKDDEPAFENTPDVTCYAKVSRFESTSLAPDSSGKCKECLREVTKRTTCYK